LLDSHPKIKHAIQALLLLCLSDNMKINISYHKIGNFYGLDSITLCKAKHVMANY